MSESFLDFVIKGGHGYRPEFSSNSISTSIGQLTAIASESVFAYLISCGSPA